MAEKGLPETGERMETTIAETIEELQLLSLDQLRARYRRLFGEEHSTQHRKILVRRIAWRLQTLAEGGLSERARARAEELASEADLRVLLPRPRKAATSLERAALRDRRLPPAGTVLRRRFRERTIEVTVLEDGFEHDGERYDSLSAVATKVAGTRWNGFAFFHINRPERGPRSTR